MLTKTTPETVTVLGLSEAGFHRIATHVWTPAHAEAPPVVCVHGLTRTGRDFDVLAEALSGTRAVYCPDVVGRGGSDWLARADLYGYPRYLADMTAVIARAGVSEIDWVGTSMGGLIGMMLAAQPGTPIRRLVLNDVGPFIPASALRVIAGYVGRDPRFADFEAAVHHVADVHAGFGRLSDAQWRHLARHAVRAAPDGGYRLAYDPGIARPLSDPDAVDDVDLWGLWQEIRCPVLVLRGAESELLTAETAAAMTRSGPGATLVTVDGAGHAPALLDADQVRTITDWLDATVPS